MTNEIYILSLTAASIGFIHTLIGPDHYLPFIMMAKAGKWSKIKTFWVTILCGAGHVLSSVVLGFIGIAAGIALDKLELIEGSRGEIAGWALIAFGFVYMVWGIKKAYRNRPHSHIHVETDGTYHTHTHRHHGEHVHVNEKKRSLTPWILFVVFVLGPCEPLIPLLMFPAAQESVSGLWIVTAVFGFTTIATMISVVMVSLWGINLLPLGKLERYTHALAGFAIFASGLAINVLGL
ncbi:MAG TPA: sulfite exporter TauE/SafE family protein [Ignavibacteria bacterium]|nr:sulfite exporter TauE/SafE family protein [Ignavibacteria bacterium]